MISTPALARRESEKAMPFRCYWLNDYIGLMLTYNEAIDLGYELAEGSD